ncbi:MAG: M28 family peptidase, partial [Dysgonamonadaceae bacterium]
MSDMEKICEPINSINPDFPFTIRKTSARPKPLIAGGTDAVAFLMAGVPTVQLGTEDIKGYNFSYREIWHTTRDTYDKCPPDYMNHASIVTAIIVYGVANLDHLLSREGYFIP